MKKFSKILVTDPLTDKDIEELRKYSENVVYEPKMSRERVLEEVEDAELLIVRSRTAVNEELLEKACKLKYVITATHGIDHVNTGYARSKGVKVHSSPSSIESVAELTFGNILNLYRNIQMAHETTHSGKWMKNELLGRQLSGKTIGIVGLGRIGRRVAQIANYGFNMKVLYYDPYVGPGEASSLIVKDWVKATETDSKEREDDDISVIDGFGFCDKVDYETLLKESNIITFHCPLTKETRRMLDSEQIKLMKPEALIINLARGPVVNEAGIVEALRDGKLAGAALDVFEVEPLPETSCCLKTERLILTPHIGGQTKEARENIGKTVLNIVKKLAENE